jgi:sucrose-6-phosphate hydrolase SacC (GH32 family)
MLPRFSFHSKLLATGLLLTSAFVSPCFSSDKYHEPFRPQFHFTPEQNWMNDPNGLVFFEGEYHLFHQYNPEGGKWGHMSWGHAVSTDLMHWEPLPVALPEKDGIMAFSGSVVVDKDNTSGFGKDGQPPMVAIYTGHREKHQDQRLAFSNDRGRTWTQYSGNPVLDIGSADFRDPKVFWHEPTKQWVMVVALAVEKKISFYASPDLKKWNHLSDFGPVGSTRGLWECPDLFQLPVEGETDAKKWVLIVNVNPGAPAGGSGCQYFVGEFDGKQFTLDSSYPAQQAAADSAPTGQVVADFETDYSGWTTNGTAFGDGPSHPNTDVTGFEGQGVADSFGRGDADTGTLTSPEFEINADFLSFLIGGGSHDGQAGINLLVDGKVVRSATGNNSANLEKQTWDVREFRGKTAKVELFDQYDKDDWGHVIIDQIVLGGSAPAPAKDNALWADYGPDFYAATSWSNIPVSDGRRIWLGWMSNWDYGQDVPTSPWRSAMTVPRTVSLRKTSDGYRLIQKPVAELEKLRSSSSQTFSGGTVAEAVTWLAEQKNLPPLLDVEMSFEGMDANSVLAITLNADAGARTSVTCDSKNNKLVVDRTKSGLADFNKKFPGSYSAPLRVSEGRCSLRLLLDTSSLEVFAQDGETVMTTIIFPTGNARTIGIAAESGTPTIKEIIIHPL